MMDADTLWLALCIAGTIIAGLVGIIVMQKYEIKWYPHDPNAPPPTYVLMRCDCDATMNCPQGKQPLQAGGDPTCCKVWKRNPERL